MSSMEFRQLGRSGLKVPVLSFGTGTFGGGTEFFKAWGASDVAEATRLVDICLEAGVNLFDTADIYSNGLSETILGQGGRRTSRKSVDLDQGYVSHGARTERPWIIPASPHTGL
jgi:aryl-alcohol dehydrogenase-like predicted oxidoreductase